jgi:hypothetical protein
MWKYHLINPILLAHRMSLLLICHLLEHSLQLQMLMHNMHLLLIMTGSHSIVLRAVLLILQWAAEGGLTSEKVLETLQSVREAVQADTTMPEVPLIFQYLLNYGWRNQI